MHLINFKIFYPWLETFIPIRPCPWQPHNHLLYNIAIALSLTVLILFRKRKTFTVFSVIYQYCDIAISWNNCFAEDKGRFYTAGWLPGLMMIMAGGTKSQFFNFFVSKIFDPAKVSVRFFESESLSYSTGVAAAELRRHLSNIKMIFKS